MAIYIKTNTISNLNFITTLLLIKVKAKHIVSRFYFFFNEHEFYHIQLYIALSRVTLKIRIKIVLSSNLKQTKFTKILCTTNIIYSKVFLKIILIF